VCAEIPRGPCKANDEDKDFGRLGFVDGVEDIGVARADVDGVFDVLAAGRISDGMVGGGSRS